MRSLILLIFGMQHFCCTASFASLPASDRDSTELSCPADLSIQKMDLHRAAERPSPLLKAFRIKQKKDKKIVAALLAFPFPFGIVGLHRIYLGCAPYVPVAYIASLGGVFGILPFIDFCVLLAEKDLDKYINSKKIFMWVN